MSDASQLLPLIWHYAYRPKPNRFWQLLLVYRHIHHRTFVALESFHTSTSQKRTVPTVAVSVRPGDDMQWNPNDNGIDFNP